MSGPLAPEPLLRHLGRADYLPTWRAMQEFTAGPKHALFDLYAAGQEIVTQYRLSQTK